MTCIEYGGGPTLEQRRAFSGSKSGSHVAGYQGFVPQFKYSYGGTFEELTHQISEKLPYYSGPHEAGTSHQDPLSYGANLFQDEIPTKKLPISTGFNKLTEKMVPGYSGDIPHAPFKFGATYRVLCDESIDHFVTSYEHNKDKQEELQRASKLFPSMRAIGRDPPLRDHLNLWVDHKCGGLLRQDRKALTEPPIPGYMGYVPRIGTTQTGLGNRYHTTTGQGLALFADETKRHQQSLQQRRISATMSSPSKPVLPEESSGGRVYVPPGMIPKYTGYLPRGRYEFGNTYGNMTRSLDACAHPYNNYGEFMRSRSAKS